MKTNLLKRSAIALLALLSLPFTAMAEEVTYDAQILVITPSGGEQISIALDQSPVLTVDGDSIVVTSLGNDKVVFPMSGLTYAFETRQVTTGINSVYVPGTVEEKPQVSFSRGEVNGLKAGSRVSIFRINGTMVKQTVAGADGRVDLQLSSLPNGIYIIKTPTTSIKIINR